MQAVASLFVMAVPRGIALAEHLFPYEVWVLDWDHLFVGLLQHCMVFKHRAPELFQGSVLVYSGLQNLGVVLQYNRLVHKTKYNKFWFYRAHILI